MGRMLQDEEPQRPAPLHAPGKRSQLVLFRARGDYGCVWTTCARRTDAPVVFRLTRTFIVGLQYHVELDESTIGFCVVPSAWLMSQALDIGISLTYYVTLDSRRRGTSSKMSKAPASAHAADVSTNQAFVRVRRATGPGHDYIRTPYGGGPKSGWSRRIGVLFVAVRPLMKSMSAAERPSTGADVTSVFHQLLVGKTWRPTSDSMRTGGAAACRTTTEQTNDTAATDVRMDTRRRQSRTVP